jgi:hypothetical protein
MESGHTHFMTDKQQKFFQCPECMAIVERVYQNGVCKSCLSEKFQAVRLIIDHNHALQDTQTKIRRRARAIGR